MISVLISLLVGMVLGQRFKVLILVPGIGLALIFTIAAGVARADGAGTIVLMATAVITSLQIGYLVGTGIRQFSAAARASRPRATSMGGSIPARHTAR
jgi:hypothetical protein